MCAIKKIIILAVETGPPSAAQYDPVPSALLVNSTSTPLVTSLASLCFQPHVVGLMSPRFPAV